jgi:hypothetical protein
MARLTIPHETRHVFVTLGLLMGGLVLAMWLLLLLFRVR